MSYNDIVQAIADASKDAETLEKVVNGDAETRVKSRLGRYIWTLATINSKIEYVRTQADSAVQQINTARNNVQALLDSKINELDNAINTAAAAGAGANGWTTDLVLDADQSLTQKQINAYLYPKLKRENLSVWDFFTPQELFNYNKSTNKDGFDVYRPVQAFLDYIVANDVGTAYCNIRGGLTQGLKLGDGSSATQQVIGRCMFTALNAINIMFEAQPGTDFFWDGMIIVNGQGGSSYNSRTCHTGFRIGDPENIKKGARSRFSKVFARRFIKWGVDCNNATTLTDIDVVRTTDCGSGFRPADNATFSKTCTISNIVRDGSSGAVSQRSTITVSALPKGLSVGDSFAIIVIKGQPYYITNVLSETSIEVFPWIDFDILSGDEGYYIDGGGVFIRGGDASVLGMQSIDAVRCGSVIWYNALYGPSIDRIVTQACGAAIVYGSSPSSPTVAANINYLYCEGNQFDLIRVTRAFGRLSINTDVAFDINKVAYTCAPRLSTNALSSYNNLQGFQIPYAGNSYESERQLIGSMTNYSTAITDKYDYIAYSNNHTISISEPNIKLLEAFGKNHRSYIVMGAGVNYAPSGSVTINAPLGFTINGIASISYTNLSSVCYVDILYRPETKNFIATLRNQNKYASVTYDPPSLANATQQSTTVTLTGAKLGDIVSVSFNKVLNGTRMWGEVTATDTVTVYHRNDTGAAVDVASGTLTVKIV